MKPIIFDAESIKSIINQPESITRCTKTQMRRILKYQPIDILPMPNSKNPNMETWVTLDVKGEKIEDNRGKVIGCRYGVPGDTLYVKETFFHDGTDEPSALHFRANANMADEEWFRAQGWKWTSPWFMRKEYARIFLEITKVRVEKLQDISAWDCLMEGILINSEEALDFMDASPNEFYGWGIEGFAEEFRETFAKRWNSIHAKPKPKKRGGVITHYESYPWENIQETKKFRGLPWRVFGNSWVWPIDFKAINK